ncbi:MAG: cytochrome c biogenesis protein ResB [Armatimonadota bacterium]
MDVLASVRLTLWLLAILAIAMAVATLIPQQAPDEAYLKAFGTVFGPLVVRTTLRNIYGSWWFIGAFAALAINLLACSIRRTQRLLAQDQAAVARAAGDAQLEGCQARWRLSHQPAEVADGLSGLLRRAGYGVTQVPVGSDGRRALVAGRGRLVSWSPVIVHVGLIIVLIGAAWGRLPSHSYRATAMLGPGEVFPANPPGEAFGLRLKDAGVEQGTKQGTRFWAKVDILEEGQAIKSQTVQPNRPLRYHGVSVVLQSVMPAGYQVAVTKGKDVSTVPVVLMPDGKVDIQASHGLLEDPPWIVAVPEFRQRDEAGRDSPAALVFADRSGHMSHQWEIVGWVGPDGVDYQGVHFALVPGMSGAQLSLDRDIGVPIVYLGFIVMSIGAMLLLGSPHRRLIARVSERGKGAQLVMSLSPASDQREAERLWAQVESDLGGAREAEPARAKEEQ